MNSRTLIATAAATTAAVVLLAIGYSVITNDGVSPAESTETDSAERTTTSVAGEGDPQLSGDGATTTPMVAGSDEQPRADPIQWVDCGDGFQCGTVTVPLDYADPAEPSLDIAMIRVPAGGEAIGSIFVNPGGPGASGIEFVRNGFRFDAETAEHYDVIGFDPRGIGQSSPLTCTFDRGESPLTDLSPDSVEESALLDSEAAGIVDGCVASDSAVLPHLTTTNVARDLDRLRSSVGDDVLHYYGLSYGTLLAVRYGQLFPGRVGHLVLDGVVDPDAELTELLRQQATAFEDGFAGLDDRCNETRCPPDGIAATFDRVHDRLEAEGPVGGVGATELVVASLLPSYSPSVFPAYAVALDQADGGNYAAIEGLSDFFVSSISFTAYAAFACADGLPPKGSDAWSDFASDLSERAPRFGAVVANELRVCAFWPSPDQDPDLVAGAEPTAGSLADLTVPVLVVGNTEDAATPLENAQRVASLLPNPHLVVLDAKRHTAYNGSACVRDLVRDYFADRLTAGESRCEAD